MAETLRLDLALVERNLVKSRTHAKTLIEKGHVTVNQKVCKKASYSVLPQDVLQVENPCPFVSRGGYKLQKALDSFSISVKGWCCVDVGASTGGFTDCLLQREAGKVYAVDVGTNQLVESLRNHPNVICKEQYNFRYAKKEDFNHSLQFACVDVSFISLSLILPPLYELLEQEGVGVCLIKPQFEAGKENIGKNGVVKSKKVHLQVLRSVTNVMNQTGFSVLGITFSPIKGGNGNIEYLAYIKKDDNQNVVPLYQMEQIVESACNQALEEAE